MSTEAANSPISTPRKLKFEQLRADYELFLQTFEKPTWLYRHLQRRSQLSPFMLNRNLSYLRDSAARRSKHTEQRRRKEFKVDNIFHKVPVTENGDETNDCENGKNFLNLSFGGFFHGPGFAEEIFLTNDPNIQQLYTDQFVRVTIHLIQVYHRHKKDKDAPMDIVELGSCQAPWNPRTQLLLPCSSVQLSVPPSAFSENGRVIKTHIISITVGIMIPKRMKKKRGRKKKEVSKDPENIEEPPSKRHKSENIIESSVEENSNQVELTLAETVLASFSAELIVYDRHRNCLLNDGEYELLLQENVDVHENHKLNTWESQFKNKLGPFAAFSFGPTIKFNLRWETKPSVAVIPVYKSLASPYTETPQPLSVALSNGNHKSNTKETKDTTIAKETPPRVFYQFIYNNSTRQQTEAKEGTYCPWCALNCRKLYGLLKHLKSCHMRFSFLYTPLKKGCHRIDVCVNDNFENTLDLDGVKDMGFINIDDAPLHRKPHTEVLVGRPMKLKRDLTEFTEPDIDETDGVAPIKGHDRVYYHERNNLQISHVNEFDNRDDDKVPDWLKEKMQDMIEEFTDVNEGEKSLMKMWNIHMLKNGYIADFTVGSGCVSFVKEYGSYILKNNLARNFLLHLNNLIEFQVIHQSTVLKAVDMLNKLEMKVIKEE